MQISGGNRRRVRRLGILVAILLVLVTLDGPLCRLEIGLIRGYQRFGSPVTRHLVTCRFTPSCSAYGLQSLQKGGLWKGNWAIIKRLARCSPFGYLADAWTGNLKG